MSVSLSPCLTAPSEKTVKRTMGAPVTVTAGTPAPCSTENADDELVDVSLAGLAAAAAMAPLTDPDGGGVTVTLTLSPPQADSAASARAATPNHFIELFMDDSITSWARTSSPPPSSCR